MLVALGQSEDVWRRCDQAVIIEGLDVLLTQAFDVEGVARGEVPKPLELVARDKSAHQCSV